MELRSLNAGDAAALGEFFAAISPDEPFFHPHPLTRGMAEVLCAMRTSDEYVVAVAGGEIVAYGMLRGWDEGYEIPSLGIAVHPDLRGARVGRKMMLHLHDLAAQRNAPSVRLKVYVDNEPAVALYRSLGYEFGEPENDEIVGFKQMPDRGRARLAATRPNPR